MIFFALDEFNDTYAHTAAVNCFLSFYVTDLISLGFFTFLTFPACDVSRSSLDSESVRTICTAKLTINFYFILLIAAQIGLTTLTLTITRSLVS